MIKISGGGSHVPPPSPRASNRQSSRTPEPPPPNGIDPKAEAYAKGWLQRTKCKVALKQVSEGLLQTSISGVDLRCIGIEGVNTPNAKGTRRQQIMMVSLCPDRYAGVVVGSPGGVKPTLDSA